MTKTFERVVEGLKEVLSPAIDFHKEYGTEWCLYFVLWLDYFMTTKAHDCMISPPDGVPTSGEEYERMKDFGHNWASRYIRKIPVYNQQSERWRYAKLKAMDYSSIRGQEQTGNLLNSLVRHLGRVYKVKETLPDIIKEYLSEGRNKQIFTAVDEMVGKDYVYNSKVYTVVSSLGKMKKENNDWAECVVYKPKYTDYLYVRELSDFLSKFKQKEF
jgi:hypothetical protein